MTKRTRFSEDFNEKLMEIAEGASKTQRFFIERYDELQLECNRLRADDREQVDQIHTLDEQVEEKQNRINDLNDELIDKRIKVAELDDEVQRLTNKNSAQTNELAELHREKNEMQDRYVRRESVIL